MDPTKKNLNPFRPIPRIEIENMRGYTAPLEGRRDMLRLDFNENTLGPSPKVIKALKDIPNNHISIYPEYCGLKEAVIENLTKRGLAAPIEASQIGLFNGVDAAINAIFHSYGEKGKKMLTTNPTFGYYTPCAQMQGMEIIAIPYEGTKFNFPLEKIKAELINQSPGILIICNPNNPTGTILSAKKILEIAEMSPKTLIVVDELYEAFLGESALPNADFQKTPNLLILRSLAKTAGLAGLRFGFTIGNEEVVNRIGRVTGPYDINSFAVTAAFAALEDQEYIDHYVDQVLDARDWIQEQLLINDVKHHLQGGNYFLIWPKRNATEIENELRKEGILIRSMKGKDLIGASLRISIGTKTQMQKFWNVFMSLDKT